jgi:hypothetical protein
MMLKHSQSLRLLDLPSELMVEIFRNLSYQNIMRCCAVSFLDIHAVENISQLPGLPIV